MTQRPHGDFLAFGPFRLFTAGRRLEKDGVEVKVGSRALDILGVLAAKAGEVVSNAELTSRVWPETAVEENALRVHIAALRKVLGKGKADIRYIGNVPGRGYYFAAEVSRECGRHPAVTAPMVITKRMASLPPRLEGIVGREQTIHSVREQVLSARFVSIVGPGGMGKTTVAVAIAHDLRDEFEGDVGFVDLGALTEPAHVATNISSAVGLGLSGGDAITSLIAFLRDRRTLLVLDSCEHLVTTLAPLVERLFAQAQQVSVLVTSREALRVEGEQIHRLQPLDSPPQGADLTADSVLSFPAAELFVRRAFQGGRSLADADAPVVAQICRGLDGIALAIEFAAGRVEAYGIRGTASLLENRLKLLKHGRRTALPRHQTLSSLLDWSFSLLSEAEQVTLRRLSVFAGSFSLLAVNAVVPDAEADAADALDALGSLNEKSLLAVDTDRSTARYRLLDTTRAYAHARLLEAHEHDSTARRLALYVCRALEQGECDIEDLGNIRAALKWSFSANGDVALGTAIVLTAAPLLMRHALLIECHGWVNMALNALPSVEQGTRREVELRAALGVSSMFTRGNSPEVREALERAVAMLEPLDESEQLLRMLGALDMFVIRGGAFELLVKRGEAEAGLRLLLPAMDTLCRDRHDILQTVFASAIAEGLGQRGQYDDALQTLDQALAGTLATNGDAFDVPEMLRLKGYLLATKPAPCKLEAEQCLLRALDAAARQAALGWELRIAVTLARLLASEGRADDALERLRTCYLRFDQGFETSDLIAARDALTALDPESDYRTNSLGKISN